MKATEYFEKYKEQMKCKHIPSIKLTDVTEITLLSTEEWEKARNIKSVPQFTGWWWLRSLGEDYISAALVDNEGNTRSYGEYVNYGDIYVRPAFKLSNLKFSNLKIGDKIFVENTVCTVIDEGYALSDTVICYHRFDHESSDFDKSEIKAFINSDEFRRML